MPAGPKSGPPPSVDDGGGRFVRDGADPTAPNAGRFEPLPTDRLGMWANFCVWPDRTFFPKHLGFEVEEIRTDYARIRLPYRVEHDQPAGVVHGGAIATLIDTVVVPAVASPYDEIPVMLTLSMNVNYTGALRQQDAVAEGWTTRRGRSIVFCEASVRAADGDLAATGTLVYKVRA